MPYLFLSECVLPVSYLCLPLLYLFRTRVSPLTCYYRMSYLCLICVCCQQQRNQLTIQVTNLQVDFDNVNARYEEESEAATSLRSQLQKAITDYTQLKSRYDKDVISKQEELEDLK